MQASELARFLHTDAMDFGIRWSPSNVVGVGPDARVVRHGPTWIRVFPDSTHRNSPARCVPRTPTPARGGSAPAHTVANRPGTGVRGSPQTSSLLWPNECLRFPTRPDLVSTTILWAFRTELRRCVTTIATKTDFPVDACLGVHGKACLGQGGRHPVLGHGQHTRRGVGRADHLRDAGHRAKCCSAASSSPTNTLTA